MGTMKGAMGTQTVCLRQAAYWVVALRRRASLGIRWHRTNDPNLFRVQAARVRL
jgi:hypothetical protein